MRKLLMEYLKFLVHEKKWWMMPLVIILFVFLTVFFVIQTTSIAPFIYALF